MADPTPKARRTAVYTLTDAELGVYIDNATRKAFEEAAYMTECEIKLKGSLRKLANVFHALAKTEEQADGR